MNQSQFESKMRWAKTMQANSTEPHDSDYYAGYQRGLRRLYHGENFGTEAEHETWMGLVDRSDEQSQQRGRGYRDGFGKNKNIVVITFRIPEREAEAIREAAANDNRSINQWARLALAAAVKQK